MLQSLHTYREGVKQEAQDEDLEEKVGAGAPSHPLASVQVASTDSAVKKDIFRPYCLKDPERKNIFSPYLIKVAGRRAGRAGKKGDMVGVMGWASSRKGSEKREIAPRSRNKLTKRPCFVSAWSLLPHVS